MGMTIPTAIVSGMSSNADWTGISLRISYKYSAIMNRKVSVDVKSTIDDSDRHGR